MAAFLVRVGVDSTGEYGGWNAPADRASGRYVYVPIPQDDRRPARPTMRRMYSEVQEPLARFRASDPPGRSAVLPTRLATREMHLDPDFEHLTYGDGSSSRGKQLARVVQGDVLVFYGAFQATDRRRPLHYVLFGKYVVEECVAAEGVHADRVHENAHTRPARPLAGDIVIRARPGVSGRFKRCIALDAQHRDGLYRLGETLLNDWGGVDVKDGAIQRGSPFALCDPVRFCAWLDDRKPELVKTNWD